MKAALVMLTALGIWLGAVAGWIAVGPFEKADKTADAAIVLGAAVDGGDPSPVFAARIDHAVILYREGRVGKVIFTGAKSPDDTKSEALAGKDYAQARGIPASAMLIEERSLTTHQNLYEAERVMKEAGLASALIVSDPLHLQRAVWMAEGLGVDASASAASQTRYQSWRTKAPFLARELYFMHHHWVFGE